LNLLKDKLGLKGDIEPVIDKEKSNDDEE